MIWRDVKTLCESLVEPWNELSNKVFGCLHAHIVSKEFAKRCSHWCILLAITVNLSPDSKEKLIPKML